MWYLVEDSPEPADTPAPRYWLGGTHSGGRIIGRKNVHIRIKAASVSRTHATVRVVPSSYYSLSENPVRQRTTSVVVEDSSAYGTYIKYPPGHPSNRTGEAAGHHRRLDKNSPTGVQEGALLAFGAPSSWWRLGWCEIVCFPSGLWARHQERLQEVMKDAGLEVVKDFSKAVTHFITGECKTSSMKFLFALVRGVHIVTPAWANSVQQTVKEACKEITEAQNNTAAVAASKLAPEALFVPPFHAADKSAFSDIIDSVFNPDTKNRRIGLFKSLVFAFSREDRRAKWAQVLEHLGASVILVRAIKGHPREEHTVIVTPDGSKRRRSTADSSPQSSDAAEKIASISEALLINAILSADYSLITKAMLQGHGASQSMSAVDAEAPVNDDEGVGLQLDTDSPEPHDAEATNGSLRNRDKRKTRSSLLAKNESSISHEQMQDDKSVNPVPVQNPNLDPDMKTNTAEQVDDPNERSFFKVAPVDSSAPPGGKNWRICS